MRAVLKVVALLLWLVTLVTALQAFRGEPLWIALTWGALALVTSALARVVPPSRSIRLFFAIERAGLERRSAYDEVAALLHAGANPNVVSQGTRALNEATMWGERKVIEALLDAGADPNGRGMNGSTPLHYVANNGHSGLVELLVDRGSDVNLPDSDGATPIHKAASLGHAETVRELIAAGADARIRSNDGTDALGVALRMMRVFQRGTQDLGDEPIREYQRTIEALNR